MLPLTRPINNSSKLELHFQRCSCSVVRSVFQNVENFRRSSMLATRDARPPKYDDVLSISMDK